MNQRTRVSPLSTIIFLFDALSVIDLALPFSVGTQHGEIQDGPLRHRRSTADWGKAGLSKGREGVQARAWRRGETAPGRHSQVCILDREKIAGSRDAGRK